VAYLALALALGVFAVGCAAPMPPSDGHPDLNRATGSVVVTSLDGASVELPAPGHVTVIDVWATWCRPCVETMPVVEGLWNDERPLGIRVVGVATDDNPGLVARRAREITYPNVVDASGEVRGWLKVRELPTLVVFDRGGRVRWVRSGATERDVVLARDVIASLERER
jgi:thiol-disulfide isomerase/thioredoxin